MCQHLIDREAALNQKDLERQEEELLTSSPYENALSPNAASNLPVTRDVLDEDMSLLDLLMRDYKESSAALETLRRGISSRPPEAATFTHVIKRDLDDFSQRYTKVRSNQAAETIRSLGLSVLDHSRDV